MTSAETLQVAASQSAAIASWVQAIGSIVAIGAGFGALLLQHYLERRQARHQVRQLRFEAISLIETAADLAERTAHQLDVAWASREQRVAAQWFPKILREPLETVDQQMAAFPIHTLADVNFIKAWPNARMLVLRVLAETKRKEAEYLNGMDVSTAGEDFRQSFVAGLRSWAETLRART